MALSRSSAVIGYFGKKINDAFRSLHNYNFMQSYTFLECNSPASTRGHRTLPQKVILLGNAYHRLSQRTIRETYRIVPYSRRCSTFPNFHLPVCRCPACWIVLWIGVATKRAKHLILYIQILAIVRHRLSQRTMRELIASSLSGDDAQHFPTLICLCADALPVGLCYESAWQQKEQST